MLLRHILATALAMLALIFLAAFVAMPVWAEAPAGFVPGNPTPPGWWKSLNNANGAWCCDGIDGADVQWDYTANGYTVFLNGEWTAVPDWAVVTAPNLHGRAVIWATPFYDRDGKIKQSIRCFLPGAGL